MQKINTELEDLTRAPRAVNDLSGEFSLKETIVAIKRIKARKVPGLDNIHPELVLHKGLMATNSLRQFCSVCMKTSELSKVWCYTKIIGLLKLNKSPVDHK